MESVCPEGNAADENTLLCLDQRGPIETKNDSAERWSKVGVLTEA